VSVVRPEKTYAKSGDVRIAYQPFGEGQLDLVPDRWELYEAVAR
jgi:hypothetical protein